MVPFDEDGEVPDPSGDQERTGAIECILDFWNSVRLGCWEDRPIGRRLREIDHEVASMLARDPPCLTEALEATARATILIHDYGQP